MGDSDRVMGGGERKEAWGGEDKRRSRGGIDDEGTDQWISTTCDTVLTQDSLHIEKGCNCGFLHSGHPTEHPEGKS